MESHVYIGAGYPVLKLRHRRGIRFGDKSWLHRCGTTHSHATALQIPTPQKENNHAVDSSGVDMRARHPRFNARGVLCSQIQDVCFLCLDAFPVGAVAGYRRIVFHSTVQSENGDSRSSARNRTSS